MDNPFDLIEQRLRSIEALLQQVHIEKMHVAKASEKYYKINQAAEFLSTSPNALRVMVSKDQIPYIKKQGKLSFREFDLIEWLESGSQY